MKQQSKEIELVCPKCGGSYFGSTQNEDRTWTRSCHGSGDGARRCGFKFDEKDDWKYFKLVTVESFESPEEYGKVYKEVYGDDPERPGD